MYCYQVLDDHRVLVLKHYGDFVKDEGNRGILDAIARIEARQLAKIRLVIRDCTHATNVSLHNTDRANEFLFEKKLGELLHQKKLDELPNQLEFVIILPETPKSADMMAERVRRTLHVMNRPISSYLKHSYSEIRSDYPGFDLTVGEDWIYPVPDETTLSQVLTD